MRKQKQNHKEELKKQRLLGGFFVCFEDVVCSGVFWFCSGLGVLLQFFFFLWVFFGFGWLGFVDFL